MNLLAGLNGAPPANAGNSLGHRLLLMRRNTKPCVVASVPCALAVVDAEQAVILQKPRSARLAHISILEIERLEDSFALRELGCSFYSHPPRHRPVIHAKRKGETSGQGRHARNGAWDAESGASERYIIDEPAHDQQARHHANPITKNVDPRHH